MLTEDSENLTIFRSNPTKSAQGKTNENHFNSILFFPILLYNPGSVHLCPPALHQPRNASTHTCPAPDSTRGRPGAEGTAMADYCEELVDSGGAEDMPRVVSALAGILERVAERNDAAAELPIAPASSSAFRATTKPGISVRAYTARIARFAGCSPACYVVGYVYLDRLLRRRGRRLALAVDSYSVHRLLITAVLAAVKFMDDM